MKKSIIFIYLVCFSLFLSSCSFNNVDNSTSTSSLGNIVSIGNLIDNITIIDENGQKTLPYMRIVGGHYRNDSGGWVYDDTLMFGTERIVKNIIKNNESDLPSLYADKSYKIILSEKESIMQVELFDVSGNYIGNYTGTALSQIPEGTYIGFSKISNISGELADGMKEYYDIGLFYKIMSQ